MNRQKNIYLRYWMNYIIIPNKIGRCLRMFTSHLSNVKPLKGPKYLEEELSKSVARNEKISGLYEKLYEDNASGKVTDEWFMQLSHKYEVERMEMKAKIAELRKRISNIGTMQQNKENFINAIRRFMEMKKLTMPLAS